MYYKGKVQDYLKCVKEEIFKRNDNANNYRFRYFENHNYTKFQVEAIRLLAHTIENMPSNTFSMDEYKWFKIIYDPVYDCYEELYSVGHQKEYASEPWHQHSFTMALNEVIDNPGASDIEDFDYCWNDFEFVFRIIFELENRDKLTMIQRDKLLKKIQKFHPDNARFDAVRDNIITIINYKES